MRAVLLLVLPGLIAGRMRPRSRRPRPFDPDHEGPSRGQGRPGHPGHHRGPRDRREARPARRLVLEERRLVGPAGTEAAVHRHPARLDLDELHPPRHGVRRPARRRRVSASSSHGDAAEGRRRRRRHHRRARRSQGALRPSHDPVQRLRMDRPRRPQRPGRAQRLRSRQRLDGRGRRDAPAHRRPGAALDVRGSAAHAPSRLRVVPVRRAGRVPARAGRGPDPVHVGRPRGEREPSRDGHRDQPLGQSGREERAIRRPAVLRRRERVAASWRRRGVVDPYLAMGAGPPHRARPCAARATRRARPWPSTPSPPACRLRATRWSA